MLIKKLTRKYNQKPTQHKTKMSNNCLKSFLNVLIKFDDVNYYNVFNQSCKDGNVQLVDLLLEFDLVDPSADDNYAIREASRIGHIAVVERLLQDGRVDPSTNDNLAIRWASQYGHIAVVDRLLQEDKSTNRVDPSAVNNYAIMWASRNGHIAVVDRLLQDGRVAPQHFHKM